MVEKCLKTSWNNGWSTGCEGSDLGNFKGYWGLKFPLSSGINHNDCRQLFDVWWNFKLNDVQRSQRPTSENATGGPECKLSMKLFGTKFVQAALQLENIFRNRLFSPENQQTTSQSLMKVNGNGRYGVFGAPHDLIIWTLKSPFWRSEKFAFVPLVLWDVPDFHIWSFGWSLKPCKQQSKSLFNHKKRDIFF